MNDYLIWEIVAKIIPLGHTLAHLCLMYSTKHIYAILLKKELYEIYCVDNYILNY